MAPFYSECCARYGWAVDNTKLAAMSAVNAKTVADIDAKVRAVLSCPALPCPAVPCFC